MSRWKQPDAVDGPFFSSGKLSKVTGAGVGTGLIVLAEILDLGPKTRLLIQCLAPSIAVFVAAVGPTLTRILIEEARLIGLERLRRKIKDLEQSVPDGAANKAELRAKTEEVENIIAERLAGTARSLSPTQPRSLGLGPPAQKNKS